MRRTTATLRDWLIECDYDHWCQGWEKAHGLFLVRADSFEAACVKLEAGFRTAVRENPRNFINCTIE